VGQADLAGVCCSKAAFVSHYFVSGSVTSAFAAIYRPILHAKFVFDFEYRAPML
jgi:hypothetical protein